VKTGTKDSAAKSKHPQDQITAAAYQMLTGEDDGRVCRDIPEAACREQPGNFLKHVIALAATKTGDGLADPKLVLSWLLVNLGAPAFLIGWLVPVREAGALLPQLVTAAKIRSLPERKWVWVGGSLIQGVAVLGMAAAALLSEGALGGWLVVGLLTGFALARSACSVSYKDVLGKTVSKATRGTATGTASSLAAAAVLLFGILLSLGVLSKTIAVIVGTLSVAGGLWIAAAAVFATVREVPGATEGGGNPLKVAVEQLVLLKDAQFRRFIATRGLLIATALGPPYLLSLAGEERDQGLGALGPFVLASSLAGLLSSYIWGRLSDVSSRRVLVLAAVVGAVALGGGALVGGVLKPQHPVLPLASILFVLMVAHRGVRLGRSTHLVDMAGAERRAAYTALSNSLVGLLLVLAGGFGLIAQLAGVPAVLTVFSLMCVGAAFGAYGLEEVQD
jgi:hypothetical protein